MNLDLHITNVERVSVALILFTCAHIKGFVKVTAAGSFKVLTSLFLLSVIVFEDTHWPSEVSALNTIHSVSHT